MLHYDNMIREWAVSYFNPDTIQITTLVGGLTATQEIFLSEQKFLYVDRL